MQKWEYLVVQLNGSTGQFGGEKVFARYVNEQEIRDWKKSSLHALLNQLGEDGWEMVSTTGYTAGGSINSLFFKRPKP